MNAKDALGQRMKENYEYRARPMLPRRTYSVIRADGRAFSSYTRHLEKPFDKQFVEDMVTTTAHLCREIQGCRLGYWQSDEISLILVDRGAPATEAWFDGNQQKIVSISASMATAKFNSLRPERLAYFDSRAFTIPERHEVVNYLIWRQQDATRNSISMAAQAHFSHASLHGVNAKQMQEKLWQEKNINWNDYPVWFRRGAIVLPRMVKQSISYVDKRTGETRIMENVERRVWNAEDPPIFSRARSWLSDAIEGVVGTTPHDGEEEVAS